jgi:hypothetical protein
MPSCNGRSSALQTSGKGEGVPKSDKPLTAPAVTRKAPVGFVIPKDRRLGNEIHT